MLVELPDAEIWATDLLRGDDDTYGLGDWRCVFELELRDSALVVRGEITFWERANDQTTIRGHYYRVLPIAAATRNCQLELVQASGLVSGPNIGARGYRWYKGEGVVRQARIITDTFGPDTSRIGGTIQFEPIQIARSCVYALAE